MSLNDDSVIDAARQFFRDHKEKCRGNISVSSTNYRIFLHDNDRILLIYEPGSKKPCPVSLKLDDRVGYYGDPGFKL